MYWDAERLVLEVVSECLKVYFGMGLALNAVFRSRYLFVAGMFINYGSLAYDFCVH